MCANFQVNKWQFSVEKKYDNYTPIPRKRLGGQNTLVGIKLTELIEPSDTMNYKPFFKLCILETILDLFFLFIFAWNKIFCSKI